MCGIAGMIDLGKDRRPAPRGAVRRMMAAIAHRGPDGDGTLDRPGLELGNVRLSIVGLADGKQPRDRSPAMQVRHNTDVIAPVKKTDTLTTVNLVYGF